MEITCLVPGLLKNDTIGPREFSKWKFIILCPCTNELWQELPLLLLWMFVQFNPSTLVNYKNGPCELKLQTIRTLCYLTQNINQPNIQPLAHLPFSAHLTKNNTTLPRFL